MQDQINPLSAREMRTSDRVRLTQPAGRIQAGHEGVVTLVTINKISVLFGDVGVDFFFVGQPIPLVLVTPAPESPRGQYIDLRLTIEEAKLLYGWIGDYPYNNVVMDEIEKRFEAILNAPEIK